MPSRTTTSMLFSRSWELVLRPPEEDLILNYLWKSGRSDQVPDWKSPKLAWQVVRSLMEYGDKSLNGGIYLESSPHRKQFCVRGKTGLVYHAETVKCVSQNDSQRDCILCTKSMCVQVDWHCLDELNYSKNIFVFILSLCSLVCFSLTRRVKGARFYETSPMNS